MKSVLRERYRYLLIKISSEKKYEKVEFEKNLKKEIIKIVGEINYPKIMPKIISYNNEKVIIRVRRDGLELTKIAIPLIRKFNEEDIHLQIVFISGTLKKLGKEAKEMGL